MYKIICLSYERLGEKNIYVGETSRPWRERIIEHDTGIDSLKKDSVFIQHWMNKHCLDTVCPDLKYEIIGSYNDCLRRQLLKAVNIIDQGIMNRKLEFQSNKLYRLEVTMQASSMERNWKEEAETRLKRMYWGLSV